MVICTLCLSTYLRVAYLSYFFHITSAKSGGGENNEELLFKEPPSGGLKVKSFYGMNENISTK